MIRSVVAIVIIAGAAFGAAAAPVFEATGFAFELSNRALAVSSLLAGLIGLATISQNQG